MNSKDKSAFLNLRDTFDDNFRLTQLYALYLERFPEAISRDMISPLCEDGTVDKQFAIGAVLSELFGLRTEESLQDRAFYRNYILPSIRILDPKKYTENPYYKNVRFPNVTLGSWELRHESYAPYRAVICDDMQIYPDFKEIAPIGFFEEEFRFPAVLEDGNEWMTLTPVDLDTCETAIAEAHGKVVTFGLGLGYYAYMAARKDEVESITVVEKSEKVIELFDRYIRPYFPHPEKLRIINADAFEYAEKVMPSERYDYAFVDTWRDASDGAPMYERMKRLEPLSSDTRFSYWIENFLISRLRALKFEELCRRFDKGELDMSYEEVKRILTHPHQA